MTEKGRQRLIQGIEILLVAIAYFLTARIGQMLAIPPGNITPVWLPSGLMLAAVLYRGYHIWPGIWLGAFAGNIWAYFDTSSTDIMLSAIFAGSFNGIGDTIGILSAAYLIQHFTHTSNPFQKGSHITPFFFFGAFMSSVISATFGVTALTVTQFLPWADFNYSWLTWWVGDSVGVLLFTPLIILLEKKTFHWSRARVTEAMVFSAVLTTLLLLSLELTTIPFNYSPPMFIIIPLLIWAIFRYSRSFAYLCMLGTATIVIVATTAGHGFLSGQESNVALIDQQLFLAIMAIITLFVSATIVEQQETNEKLQKIYGDQEQLVEERTQALLDALDDQQKLNIRLNITALELKETQEQLLHSQKMEALGRLAGGIAHDFNNILYVILGNAELLIRKADKNNNSLKNLNEIKRGAERATDLVKQILTFSNMEATNLALTSVPQVIEDALQMARAIIPAQIEIYQNIKQNCPLIMADRTQIHQIVLNLSMNAYHAMEENGGLLEVVLDSTESSLILTVKDTGHGIAPEHLNKVFDPFFTTKDVDKGTGLGLSVVHGIVKSHGGEIHLESSPNKGTMFTIQLPLSRSE